MALSWDVSVQLYHDQHYKFECMRCNRDRCSCFIQGPSWQVAMVPPLRTVSLYAMVHVMVHVVLPFAIVAFVGNDSCRVHDHKEIYTGFKN